jgi:hypothetical protein
MPGRRGLPAPPVPFLHRSPLTGPGLRRQCGRPPTMTRMAYSAAGARAAGGDDYTPGLHAHGRAGGPGAAGLHAWGAPPACSGRQWPPSSRSPRRGVSDRGPARSSRWSRLAGSSGRGGTGSTRRDHSSSATGSFARHEGPGCFGRAFGARTTRRRHRRPDNNARIMALTHSTSHVHIPGVPPWVSAADRAGILTTANLAAPVEREATARAPLGLGVGHPRPHPHS